MIDLYEKDNEIYEFVSIKLYICSLYGKHIEYKNI